MGSAMSILAMKDITKTFPGVKALSDVTFQVEEGEIHCLAGENGSGKSTLIKVISGVHPPDAGVIEIEGRRFSRLAPMEAIALGVQVIYQDFSVFPNLSVMENLALNMEVMDHRVLVNYRRVRSIAAHAVSQIGFDIDLDERVENLSVADRQLIAVCRALLQDSKLIIMDEPTSALTKREVKALFAVIKGLQSRGISVLFVSHKLDEVFEISERFTIFRNGENVASGSTRDLDRRTFAMHMTGREFVDEFYRPGAVPAAPALSVRNLTLRGAYSDVSFDLAPREILGITGLLGSGRTELDTADVRSSLRSLMWRNVGIERNGPHLEEANEIISFWSRYVLDKIFDAPTGWELQNMLQVATLIARSAALRTETRGVHFRTDFPDTDDAHWRLHIDWQCQRNAPALAARLRAYRERLDAWLALLESRGPDGLPDEAAIRERLAAARDRLGGVG